MPGGRLAIVTGASQGIGSAIAARLAREGWGLALVARRADALAEVAHSLPAAQGTVEVYACDVGDPQAAGQTVEMVLARFGRVDALVNNAGVARDALLVRMTHEQWREVLRTNLDGAFNFIRAVAPIMMRARGGRIVNVTSVIGQTGNAGQANYAASKAGLIGLTMSVARELAGRAVTVNAVAPGLIDTAMTRGLPESAIKELTERIPLRRLGTGDDVAGVVSFLLGEDAAYLTGQVINCDGGMVMG
jgi:3-oxoacyl-[acyl-carrier protein] reductase